MLLHKHSSNCSGNIWAHYFGIDFRDPFLPPQKTVFLPGGGSCKQAPSTHSASCTFSEDISSLSTTPPSLARSPLLSTLHPQPLHLSTSPLQSSLTSQPLHSPLLQASRFWDPWRAWGSLKPTWASLGPVRGQSGPVWGQSRPVWGQSGLVWGQSGPVWGQSGG